LHAAENQDAALADRALVCQLIAVAAMLRRESRGGHFRADHPKPLEVLRKRSFLTLKQAQHAAAEVLAPARRYAEAS
jgi:L-aspartate oxidase